LPWAEGGQPFGPPEAGRRKTKNPGDRRGSLSH
jgi:hypothetical protein